MKNISGRDPASAWKVTLNLFVFSAALVGTILSYANPSLWSHIADVPRHTAAIVLSLSFLYFLTGYVFHPGQGKIRNLYFLEGSGGPWMYAFDAVGVHEYDVDYSTNPKIDYVKERFQIVNLRTGRVAWKKQTKTKRDSRLTFLGLKEDLAYFKSRNLGPHALDLGKGYMLPQESLKAKGLESAPTDESWMEEKMEKEGGDQTAKRVAQYKLPTGEVVELRGQGDEKELWVNGRRRGKETYTTATLYHNDAPGMLPASLEKPRSVVIGHFRRIGGRKNWCLTRVNIENGDVLWTLEERKLFPTKIKSDEGVVRLQSLYAGRDTVMAVFTTPRTYEDVAFRIDAKSGRPLWKYVF